MEILNKIRKNAYCVVEVEHSESRMHGPTTRYTRLVLARVAESNRDGVVRRVIFAGSTHSVQACLIGRVHAIPSYQAQAARLFAATTKPGADYASREELKAALETAHLPQPA